ncbi:MAG: hypothetical protein IJY90_03730 [Clostridia bacterium]|nr:hypothetical protein [Clostridia bacterium]
MNAKEKLVIEKELRSASRTGRIDEGEVFAVLDALLTIYQKATGTKAEKDLYEKVMLNSAVYRDYALKEETVDMMSYLKTFPKEFIKGFALIGDDMEKSLVELISKMVEVAVENGYKESKIITISDQATYKADMEQFEEEAKTAKNMMKDLKETKGEEGVLAVNAYLNALAKKTIATQREYFFNSVDNIVKMHANIELTRREEVEFLQEQWAHR